MLQLEDSGQDRPTLPDWFLSSSVTTRQTLKTLEPWISFRDQDGDGASKDKSSPPDTTAPEIDIYQIDSHVYKSLLALARPIQHSSLRPTARFDYDVLALRLPGEIKQPPGLDFLAAVAKRIARDIDADFIHLDYDILQAINPHYRNASESDQNQPLRALVRQGNLEKPLSTTKQFEWTDYFHEILSAPRLSTRRTVEKQRLEANALVVTFMDLWRETGDESQMEQQEEIRQALGKSLRSFTTREYPVLVLAVDVPASSANKSPPMHVHHPLHFKNQMRYKDRYETMNQIGQRPLRRPIEICPVPSQAQRHLMRRDQERNVARHNVRRIQSYAKRFSICTTSRFLDPPNQWEFLESSPAYKALSDPDLSNNQVASIASQLRTDCSEANIRLVVSSALAWSECLSSWADERESKRAETLDVDGDTKAASNESQDPASRRSKKIRDVIERIKKDRDEFEWEYQLIDSIIEPAEMGCTWDDIEIDEAPKSYIKRLLSHNFSQAEPYGVLKSGGVRGALFYGPPGTGKTHLARILAKESSAAMISVSAAELESCWAGETEKIIKSLFRLGRMLFPSIVFIDEAEAFLNARSQRDQRWEVSRVNQFLREADGLVLRKDSPFLLLATNNPMLLDKAALRRVPGTLYIGPPSLHSRREIFRIILREEDLDPSLDLSYLASRTHRFSGSDIKALCFNAASTCQMDVDASAEASGKKDKSSRRVLTMAHFEEAFKTTRPTVMESVMQPLSEFASEFDQSAFAKMEAFRNEKSETFHTQWRPSRSIQSTGHDIQSSHKDLAEQVGAKISSNTTDIAAHKEGCVNGIRPAGSPSFQVHDSDPSPSTSSRYVQVPLDSSTGEIRLLQIDNADDLERGGPIRCSLHIASLSERPSFTALSYVWGEPGLTEEVLVDGVPVQVRSNLTAALRRTPYHWLTSFPGRPVNELRIWADALCIDQQNLAERNHQVAMMGEIYTQAELVMSSIAKESPIIRRALQIYRDIHATLFSKTNPPDHSEISFRRWALRVPSLRDLTGPHSERSSQPAWDALHQFADLPYWRRVWIIQEIFLARRVLLICDFEALDFTCISEISSRLSLEGIDAHYEDQARMQGELGGSPIGQRLCCTTCYNTISNPAPILKIYGLKDGEKRQVGTPGFQIKLLRMTTQLQASEPRDVVYGLLGLSKLPVDVDYSQTIGAVFSQYVQHWIGRLTTKDENGQDEEEQTRASLGFTYCLVFAGSARGAHTSLEEQAAMLPSWVPKFCTSLPESQFDPERQISMGNKAWNFSDLFGPEYAIHLQYPVLGINGFQLDLVQRSTELAEKSDGSLRWLAWDRIRTLLSEGSPYVTGIPPLQALMRVMQSCSANATSPLSKTDAQDVVMGFTLRMMSWKLPMDGAGVQHLPIRLLDPDFKSPFTPVNDASSLYRWIARAAFPNYPELEEKLPDYFDNWEQIRKEVGSATPYNNVSWIELKGGFFGLGPSAATEQDVVCTLQGCRRPVILRKEGDHYTLIGTCYVLGFTGWDEVKGVIQKDKLNQQTFKIR